MIFYHGTTENNWKKIQKDGILFGCPERHPDGCTYLTVDFDEACCYGDVVLAVEYDPYKDNAKCNYFDENCWQIRVYEPIHIAYVRPVKMQRFIRIGEIPEGEKSNIYRGDEKIGEEEGVCVYRAIKVDRKWNIIFPSPLRERKIFTLLQLKCMLERGDTKAYLCGGDVVGTGSDGEPLIRNVEIFADITKDIIGNLNEI